MVKVRTVITDSTTNPNVKNPSVLQTVYYRRGMMRRKGAEATDIVSIANCETKTGFLIDLSAHEYRNYRVVKFASEAQRGEYLHKTGGRAVQVESKTVDMGERKAFFGYPAKHFVTTIRRSQDAHNAGGEETIDGWYIEHESSDNDCAPDFVRSEPYYVVGTGLVDYPEIAQFHHAGPLPTGMPVRLKVTSKLAATKDGGPGRTITIEKTVEEISESPLAPSLFELPNGLHENPQLFRGKPTF